MLPHAWKHLWSCGFLTVACCVPVGSSYAAEPFTFIALPDTQNYVNSSLNAPFFTDQTQWIADQVLQEGNPRNIQFVSHLGDWVSSAGDAIQWQRADESISILDGVVKYSVLPGNHDYLTTSVKRSGTDNDNSYFGPSRFSSEEWRAYK